MFGHILPRGHKTHFDSLHDLTKLGGSFGKTPIEITQFAQSAKEILTACLAHSKYHFYYYFFM